jgi:hypothetical protein
MAGDKSFYNETPNCPYKHFIRHVTDSHFTGAQHIKTTQMINCDMVYRELLQAHTCVDTAVLTHPKLESSTLN